MKARHVVVSGAFDDIRSRHIRFLEEAARTGLTVLLWADDLVKQQQGRPPQLPEAERFYFLQAIRFVQRVQLIRELFARRCAAGVCGAKARGLGG